jgi:GAF domain-containing protein
MNLFNDYEPDDLDVKVAELLVATADYSDHLIEDAVPQVLKLLRSRLKMDVVFVSEFVGGERVLRHVAQAPDQAVVAEGQCDPLESTWCQRVVDGRMPEFLADASVWQAKGLAPSASFPVGTFLSAPIVLSNGQVYGTICCLSFGPNDSVNEAHLRNLKYTARLTAQKIEQGRGASDRARS